jgi:basic amino acid/polyamine antiporter, APA family
MAQVTTSKSMVAETPARTRRALGLWASMALVIGNMIGSGIFLLPASLAPFRGISIVGWLFTSVGALFLALLFSRLASMAPRVGGPYAYTRLGFGELFEELMHIVGR